MRPALIGFLHVILVEDALPTYTRRVVGVETGVTVPTFVVPVVVSIWACGPKQLWHTVADGTEVFLSLLLDLLLQVLVLVSDIDKGDDTTNVLSKASCIAHWFGADLEDATAAGVDSLTADFDRLSELTENGGSVDGELRWREGLAEVFGVAFHDVGEPGEVDFGIVLFRFSHDILGLVLRILLLEDLKHLVTGTVTNDGGAVCGESHDGGLDGVEDTVLELIGLAQLEIGRTHAPFSETGGHDADGKVGLVR